MRGVETGNGVRNRFPAFRPFLAFPAALSVDSRPSFLAIGAFHAGSPNGWPRRKHFCKASSSVGPGVALMRSGQSVGRGTGHGEMRSSSSP